MIFIANVAQKDNGLESIISIEAKDRNEAEQIISARNLSISSIKENPSFNLNQASFGKPITVDDFNQKVFLPGADRGGKFGLVFHMDRNRNLFVLAWDNDNDLINWMKQQGVQFPYFKIETKKLIKSLLQQKGLQYLLYNNTKDAIGTNSGILDLYNLHSVATYLTDSIELNGIDPKTFLDFAVKMQSKYPSLSPLKLMEQCKYSISAPISKLVENDDFNLVWDVNFERLKELQTKNEISCFTKFFEVRMVSGSTIFFENVLNTYRNEFSSDLTTILKKYVKHKSYSDLPIYDALIKIIKNQTESISTLFKDDKFEIAWELFWELNSKNDFEHQESFCANNIYDKVIEEMITISKEIMSQP